MKNFEFKSQVATSVEQSKRLLELGLKKETADMYHNLSTGITEVPYTEVELQRELEKNDIIPAWSLHRLLCLYGADYTIKEVYNNAEECYGMLISAIGIAIEDGDFNQDYLEEKL